MHKVFHVIMIIEQVKRKNLLNKKIPSVSEMEVAQRYKLFTLYTLLTLPGWQKLCEGTNGLRRKVWSRTEILSPSIHYFVAMGRRQKLFTGSLPLRGYPHPPLITGDGGDGGVGGDVDLPAIRPNSMPSCSGVNPTLSSTILKGALLQLDLSSSCKSHCFLLFLGSHVNTHMEFFSSILSSKWVEFVEPLWS